MVLASDGYPVAYEKGLRDHRSGRVLEAKKDTIASMPEPKFDERTDRDKRRSCPRCDSQRSNDLKEARANAYKATEWVEFDNKYMRHDIGKAIDEA